MSKIREKKAVNAFLLVAKFRWKKAPFLDHVWSCLWLLLFSSLFKLALYTGDLKEQDNFFSEKNFLFPFFRAPTRQSALFVGSAKKDAKKVNI